MSRAATIRRETGATRAIRTGALLVLTGTLAACEGGYTEATSPCVGADAPRLSFHAGAGTGPTGGPEVASRRGDPCAFTVVGAP